MFYHVLNKHDPTDKRSHGILKFFAEDLLENEKIEFAQSIFNSGSWVLSTEISKNSDSDELKKIIEKSFVEVFDIWVRERIIHSSRLSSETKNPNLPNIYFFKFREALFSIKNLGFSKETMIILEKFISQINSSYLDKFIENCFGIIIEEFNVDEIEKFFKYFSQKYIESNSKNFAYFLHEFLNSLSYSHKIFNLSESFSEHLNQLSIFLKNNVDTSNNFVTRNILLIEFINKRELDLSNSTFSPIIEESFSKIEKGSIDNLDYYNFLKRFKYHFKEFDFEAELKIFTDKIQVNIDRIYDANFQIKKSLFHHFFKSSELYFNTFLFYLEGVSLNLKEVYLLKYLELIDELRLSFSSLLWFDQFSKITSIQGKIIDSIDHGFTVEINPDFFNSIIENTDLETFKTDDFIEQNNKAFLNLNYLRYFPNIIDIHSNYKKISRGKKDKSIDITSLNTLDSFLIQSINYSKSNKLSILSLIPPDNEQLEVIEKYKLNLFFSSIELFLIQKAERYLNSTALKKTYFLHKLFSYKFNNDYYLELPENTFWKVLQKKRPHLYESIYIPFKKKEADFQELVRAYKEKETIKGTIISKTKGGMFVRTNDQQAFLPGSHIDVNPIVDYDQFIGKTMDFKVVKVYFEFKNVVVSHRAVINDQFEKERDQKLSNLKIGIAIDGIVKNITSYGVFIDLGGFDGLIHITDLAWEKIKHPSEVLSLNQTIKVKVLDFDENKTRIALGLKQLTTNPWNTIHGKLKSGDHKTGKVILIYDYGIFVEILPGIEGLIHKSEKNKELLSKIQIDQNIKVEVITLDIAEHKMSIELLEVLQEEWEQISNAYPLNSNHFGKVTNITKFGIFVELKDDIQGLIHKSKFIWKKESHPNNYCKIGQELEVTICQIDHEHRRISLDCKQLLNHPRRKIESAFLNKEKVTGKIVDIKNGTGIVSFDNSISGICPSRYMKKNNGSKAKVNEILDFNIIEYNGNRLILSHSGTL